MPLSGERGLTIIEVLVATAVFGMVVFLLGGAFTLSSTRARLGQDVTIGALLAQQRLEVLRTKAYAVLPAFAGTDTVNELGTVDPAGRFTRITTVTTPVLATPKLTQIEVTVNWDDQGFPRTITITTMVADL